MPIYSYIDDISASSRRGLERRKEDALAARTAMRTPIAVAAISRLAMQFLARERLISLGEGGPSSRKRSSGPLIIHGAVVNRGERSRQPI